MLETAEKVLKEAPWDDRSGIFVNTEGALGAPVVCLLWFVDCLSWLV